jgi:hypothetical protein
VLLVGYSVAAHGFGIRSRIRSLTVLDQKSHSAVTVARSPPALALLASIMAAARNSSASWFRPTRLYTPPSASAAIVSNSLP